MRFRLGFGVAALAISMLALTLSLAGTGNAVTTSGAHPAAQHAGPASLPAWHALTLLGGWKYGKFGSYHAAFYKDAQHVVHLRGSLAGGAVGANAFRLPKGDRPAHTLWLQVYAFDGSSGGLEITADGFASPFDPTTKDTEVSEYTSLDGISFRVP
jgi:hypothetical protein